MKTIENLSHGGQIRRLRELAEAALSYYDLGNARISLLSRHENSVFQVVASPVIRRTLPELEHADDDYYEEVGEEEEDEEQDTMVDEPVLELNQAVVPLERPTRFRYALRLYTENTISSALLSSELQWLSALRRDTGLLVPEPVPARNGALLTEVPVEGMPHAIRCVVFRWVDGRFIDASLTPIHLERVGVLMARLHHHARTFSPPSGFLRPRWEPSWIIGENSVINPQFAKHATVPFSTHATVPLSTHASNILQATARKIEAEIQSLPQDAENYGLIHYDLQQTNYLFYKDEARAIDFKDCCFGYYLFDIAITLSSLLNRPGEQAMSEAFFRGYASLRTLPPQCEERLPAFIAMSLIKRANQLLHTRDAQTREMAPEWLAHIINWLEKFLEP
ncbi:MAG TPA: phosphotransferase [Ktedonobacteraceae bacterium]|nr:phosphotransferase [Ktedonobacteraceae bacterium]